MVVECDESVELPLRPRMLRVIAANLAENALRYAGEGTTFTLIARRAGDLAFLEGSDDGPRGERRGSPAAVRALLSRRSGTLVPGHRPRPRDRQAHRRLGKRHGRGVEDAGRGVDRHVRVPGLNRTFPGVHRTAAHCRTKGVILPSMDTQREEAPMVFLLTGEEREALTRILQVVEDEWWLDDLEHALLERLEGVAAVPAAA